VSYTKKAYSRFTQVASPPSPEQMLCYSTTRLALHIKIAGTHYTPDGRKKLSQNILLNTAARKMRKVVVLVRDLVLNFSMKYEANDLLVAKLPDRIHIERTERGAINE